MLFSEDRIFIKMFKQFDIDYDKITIDGQVVKKPSYINPSEWLSFWDFPSSVEYEEALDKAYQSGREDCEKENEWELENFERENERKLEDLEKLFYKELEKLEYRIEDILSNEEYSKSDIELLIQKEVGKVKDIVWR